MRYRELSPPPVLADTVACLWCLEAPADPDTVPEPVLPDGSPELIVQLGDPYLRTDAGAERLQPRVFVVGPVTRALWLRPAGRACTLGVRFRPGRGGRVLGADLSALRDREVGLDDLWGKEGRELAERLQAAADPSSARALAVEALLRRHAHGAPPHAGAAWAVDELFRRRGGAAVQDLARRSGWSRRHLEREVARAAGMPLRTLRRIARLQHVLERVEGSSTVRWGEVALACGYADQAHLVRDFRDLAGRPPEAHRTGAGELTRAFA
jgi:AraC-like DNA-binding protein